MSNKRTAANRRRKVAIAAPAAGLALAALCGTGLAASPAQAAQAQAVSTKGGPGIGDLIDFGSGIYEGITHCLNNQAAGIDCMQSDSETLLDVHTKVTQIQRELKEFMVRYAADRQETKESFDHVVANQADASVREQWAAVRADLETTHVSMKLYSALVDCVGKATDTSKPNQTCESVDQFGNDAGTQPADVKAIKATQEAFLAHQDRNSMGNGGYRLSPTDFQQRIAGTTTNPYESDSVMNAMLEREQAHERARQGLAVNKSLVWYPASYVNKVGKIESAMSDLSRDYYTVRIFAARMRGDTVTASALDRLAQSGRGDSSPVLSLGQQHEAFLFPGWSREKPLKENQSYLVGKDSGVHKITLVGNGTTADKSATLPTGEQVVQMAKDIGNSGTTYSKMAKAEPAALPEVDGQIKIGNAAQAGRFWTAPQQLTHAVGQGRDVTIPGVHGDYTEKDLFAPWGTSDFTRTIDVWGLRNNPDPAMGIGPAPYEMGKSVNVVDESVAYGVYDAKSTPDFGFSGRIETPQFQANYPDATREAEFAGPMWDLKSQQTIRTAPHQVPWVPDGKGLAPSGNGVFVVVSGSANAKAAASIDFEEQALGGALQAS